MVLADGEVVHDDGLDYILDPFHVVRVWVCVGFGDESVVKHVNVATCVFDPGPFVWE